VSDICVVLDHGDGVICGYEIPQRILASLSLPIFVALVVALVLIALEISRT
jgi:hypothetical protein